MLDANFMMKLLSRREWVLMFLATLLLALFMAFLLIFPVLTWIVFIMACFGLIFFGYKAFFAKGADGAGFEKSLQNANLGVLGQDAKRTEKKRS